MCKWSRSEWWSDNLHHRSEKSRTSVSLFDDVFTSTIIIPKVLPTQVVTFMVSQKRQLPNFSYIMTMWHIPQKYATRLVCPRWQSGCKNKRRFFVKNSPGSIVRLNNSPLVKPQKQPSLIHPLKPPSSPSWPLTTERKLNKKPIQLSRTTCVVGRVFAWRTDAKSPV